jgi:MUN domain
MGDLCMLVFSNGCVTSEDMLWKLDALQSFILELHWPDEVFAEHLTHRLKLMSADMIEAAAKRWENFAENKRKTNIRLNMHLLLVCLNNINGIDRIKVR